MATNRKTSVSKPATETPQKAAVAINKSFSSKEVIEEQKKLTHMIPLSPSFLGKKIQYDRVSDRQIHKAAKLRLGVFRADVSQFAARKGICKTRHEIQESLEQFPFVADLHAINAVLNYCDLVESGHDKDKIAVLKESVVEISIAICNGGDSVFNVTWFLRIYSAYLAALLERVKRLISASRKFTSGRANRAAISFLKSKNQLLKLMTVREKMEPHVKLQRTVKNTLYLINPIRKNEIRESCKAFLENEPKRVVGRSRRAEHVLYVQQTTSQLLANVPIFNKYLEGTLKAVPDFHRELILRKKMVLGTMMKMEFQLTVSAEEYQYAFQIAKKLFNASVSVIQEHLENAVLKKEHELFHFLTLGWLVTESKNLPFDRLAYRELLNQSIRYLTELTTKRCQFEQSASAARGYLFEIKELLNSI